MDRYLPIGSIVLLKNGKKRLMIYGRKQLAPSTGQTFDYAACLYPEGNIEENNCFLFNHDQIERVYFLGLQDKEEDAFEKTLHN